MFSSLVVAYLFAGGMGAAASFSLSALCLHDARLAASGRFRAPRGAVGVRDDGRSLGSTLRRRFYARGYAAASASLFAGAVCLLLDVGRADRVLALFVPRATFLSFGTWALTTCLALSVVAGLVWATARRLPRTGLLAVLHAACLAAGAATVAYASLLLASMPAVPLWHSGWLALLFALSSASCGLALVLGVSHVGAWPLPPARARALAFADMLAIVAEAASFLLLAAGAFDASASAATGTQESLALSVRTLLFGDDAWVLWLAFLGFGIVGAFALEGLFAARPRNRTAGLAACACVLAGGFALRWCVLEAGLHPVVAGMPVAPWGA